MIFFRLRDEIHPTLYMLQDMYSMYLHLAYIYGKRIGTVNIPYMEHRDRLYFISYLKGSPCYSLIFSILVSRNSQRWWIQRWSCQDRWILLLRGRGLESLCSFLWILRNSPWSHCGPRIVPIKYVEFWVFFEEMDMVTRFYFWEKGI